MNEPNPPSTVTIAILTTITIVLWIFYSVYQVFESTPTVDISSQILSPIDPSLDEQTLNELPTKIYFKENEFVFLPKLEIQTENQNAEISEDPEASDDSLESPEDENTDQADSQDDEFPPAP